MLYFLFLLNLFYFAFVLLFGFLKNGRPLFSKLYHEGSTWPNVDEATTFIGRQLLSLAMNYSFFPRHVVARASHHLSLAAIKGQGQGQWGERFYFASQGSVYAIRDWIISLLWYIPMSCKYIFN